MMKSGLSIKRLKMSRRSRVEDLGRIAEKLDMVLNGPFLGDFSVVTNDHEKMITHIIDLKDELSDIWHIARFGDDEDLFDNIRQDSEQ